MFNIHKKCEARYNKLSEAYAECYSENAKLKDKVTVMKQDNLELAEMVKHTQVHIEALCLINAALMEVVTKKQKDKAYKILKKNELKIKPTKTGKLAKGAKNAKKHKKTK